MAKATDTESVKFLTRKEIKMRALLLAASIVFCSTAVGQVIHDPYSGTYLWVHPSETAIVLPHQNYYAPNYGCNDNWVERSIHRSNVEHYLWEIERNQRQMLWEQRMNQWNW